MTILVKVKVIGLAEVHTKVKGLTQGLLNTSDLAYQAGYIIELQAKKNATGRPGPRVQTGWLRSSITTSLASPTSAIVGTNVFYAPFVELGHFQHVGQFVPPLKKRLVRDRAPAYPFLFPAIIQSRDKIRKLVQKYIDKIWGKNEP